MGKRGPDKLYEARLYVVLPQALKTRLLQDSKLKEQTVSQWLRELIEVALEDR